MSLKALARSSGGTISEMLHFPVSVIEVDPDFNVRLDTPERQSRIREYANTMKNSDVGFLRNRPLTVRLDGDRVFVVDGHTRLAAVLLANSEGAEIIRLPCLSAPAGSDAVDLDYQLFQSNSGEPLSGLEQGIAFKRLLAKGQEVPDIAARIGKSQGHIRNMLALVGADPAVRQAVVKGQISATEAAKVVKANGTKAGAVIARATERARSEGRDRARPRDVEAVTKPRTEPVSLCSLAVAVVRAWNDWNPQVFPNEKFQTAIEALEKHLGPLAT